MDYSKLTYVGMQKKLFMSIYRCIPYFWKLIKLKAYPIGFFCLLLKLSKIYSAKIEDY